ncbi:MAG TPA: Ig-like domain-containing protein [Myxococcales bacterium]|nr:Ig-like domain-containing protein [Myxococcales bacterium]
MKRFTWMLLLASACGPTVKTVSVEPGQAMMSTKGASLVLHAVAKDDKGQPVADTQFTWSSANSAAASVDANGKVTALKSGAADITATAGDVKGISHIRVEIPAQLSILPAQASLTGMGQSAQLHAVVKDDAGNVVQSMPVIWTSSNANVASVDTRGMVHAMGGGTAVISARTGALSSTASVTVAEPKFDKLAVSPKGPVKLKMGKTEDLKAEAMEGSKKVEGVTVTWSSDDMKVATVTPTGMVTAMKKGKATIWAKAGDKKAEVKVMVK